MPTHTPPATGPPPAPARRDAQRGVTAVEFAGWLPVLLIVALAGIQLGLVGYAVQQAGTGARAAARVASQDDIADRYQGAGRAAVSDWLTVGYALDAGCGGSADVATVTASVRIPSVLPFVDGFGSASRSVTMPCD
ncbi:TadE/TadG family type IV pilus assembly protein [Streptomyces bohaiensis]|uniref:TadE/TadG family type IV pilus assembly protein n=1 Tax=Streptomyces bohaiensis TaxID=1431344 RepID=UPI003B765F84